MANRQQRVMIIESEPLLTDAIAFALAARGFHTMRALTRRDGERMLHEDAIDILIAHGHLPGDEKPFQFALDASVAWPALAIVAVVNDSEVDHGFALGRIRVLPKPFDLDDLIEAIEKARQIVAGHEANDHDGHAR